MSGAQGLAEAFNSDDGTVKDALYMSCTSATKGFIQ